jgi:transcriptional regulator with XRE-family HTH domain
MKTRIKELRTSKGMQQKDLAEASGLAQAVVSKLENEKQELTADLMAALSKGLQVHPIELIDDPAWNITPPSRLNEALLRMVCKSVFKLSRENPSIDDNVGGEVIASLYRRFAAQVQTNSGQYKHISDAADLLVGHELAKHT